MFPGAGVVHDDHVVVLYDEFARHGEAVLPEELCGSVTIVDSRCGSGVHQRDVAGVLVGDPGPFADFVKVQVDCCGQLLADPPSSARPLTHPLPSHPGSGGLPSSRTG